MYTNRIDTAGNPFIENGIGNYPNDYEAMNCFKIIFCPYCGTMNYVKLNWYGSIKGLMFCDRCGGEIG